MTYLPKCTNKDCTMSPYCWRHKAPDTFYQSYTKFEQDKDGQCVMFEPMTGNQLREAE